MPPIACILKSPPFWALFFLHFGHLWSFYFFLVAAPKYLNEVNFTVLFFSFKSQNRISLLLLHIKKLLIFEQVLKFDLTKSGLLASAPYLSRFICGFLFGMLSDFLIKHDILSVTSIRKFFSVFCKLTQCVLAFCFTCEIQSNFFV